MGNMPSVELMYYMHNFQRRLCWALSSICQQVGEIPEIVVNIASLPKNGNPCTEDVVDFYRGKGLQIKHTIFREDERDLFARVSNVKTRQITESSCEWLFKPDADHVFSPNFFKEFLQSLIEHQNCPRCMGSRERITTELNATNSVINSTKELYIENVYDKALAIPRRPQQKFPRIGNHIAFRKETFMAKCNGTYALRHYDSHLFRKGMHSRSDSYFRVRMGQTVLMYWPAYIHLEHIRDKELKYHTEEQR